MRTIFAPIGFLWAVMAYPAGAQDTPAVGDAGQHDSHGAAMFSMIKIEAGYAHQEGELWTWELDGWIGGDTERLWLRSQGEITEGKTGSAEAQVFYGWNFHPFWDVLVGIRQEFEPDSETWLAAGVTGLAPYFFETEVTAFLSADGDAAFRFEQSFDLLVTQRLIAEPHVEINLYAQDMPSRGIGAGFSDVEAGVHLRYEITRKFAPFAEVTWERDLGETAGATRAAGERVEETIFGFGLRVWF